MVRFCTPHSLPIEPYLSRVAQRAQWARRFLANRNFARSILVVWWSVRSPWCAHTVLGLFLVLQLFDMIVATICLRPVARY
jgi:hypothetical protein